MAAAASTARAARRDKARAALPPKDAGRALRRGRLREARGSAAPARPAMLQSAATPNRRAWAQRARPAWAGPTEARPATARRRARPDRAVPREAPGTGLGAR